MNTKIVFLSVFLSCFLISATLIGQTQRNMPKQGRMHQECVIFEDMTDAQRKEIEEIKFATHERVSMLRADLKIKNAELDKMRMSIETSQVEIDKKINEIAGLRAEIMKERVAGERAIMEKLSPEQRAKFRMHKSRRPGASMHKQGDRHRRSYDARGHQMKRDCINSR